MSQVSAHVNFDLPAEYEPARTSTASREEPVCHVLMITVRHGIAIKVDNEDQTRYQRVGYVYLRDTRYAGRPSGTILEEYLTIADFPDAQSITLV
jgi:hypothetical protein